MQKEKIYSCIAIDDETNAIADIEEYIDTLPNLNLISTYNDPIKALKEILAGQKVDFIFMDVNMPTISGVELSQAIRHKTNKLIFTTSHSKYALDAFEVDADAFLLKPFTFEKFSKTMNKLFPGNDRDINNGDKVSNDFFLVKSKGDDLRMVKIKYKEVIAFESANNYIKIHLDNDKIIIVYLTLKDVKELLSHSTSFIQFHRAFIISKDHISYIEGNTVGMINNLCITIGDTFKDGFSKFIESNLFRTSRRRY